VISTQALNSIERIFMQAARSRLPVDASHSCEVVPAALTGINQGADANVVILTIASIDFRILLMLHFSADDTTRRYYVGGGAEGTLLEAFMEVANLCCGAMNQQLVEWFPDLGMSTPYALGSACVRYIDELKPNHVATYEVTIESTVRLGATLCVCASAPLDFVASVADMTESAGELELF
jgi:hypothetical protein